MEAFGPFSVTAGAIQQVAIGMAADRVYVANDSPYDTLVSFAASRPTVVTQAGSDPTWVAWVPSKQGWTIPVQADPTGFSGNVWLLPLNTRNTSQALNGTVPSLANILVQSLLPGEPEPPSAAWQDQQTIASQPRVVTVPVTPSVTSSGTGGGTPNQFSHLSQASDLSGIAQGTTLVSYLHYLNMTPTSAVLWGYYGIYFVITDVANTDIQRVEVARFLLVGSVSGTTGVYGQVSHYPAVPGSVTQTMPANGRYMYLESQVLNSAGNGNVSFAFSAGWSVDTHNQVKVAPVGTPYYNGPSNIF